MADKTIPQLPRLDESPAPEDLIIVQDVSDGANGTTKAVKRSDFGGVQSVTGDGVGGTTTDVVLTFPTAGEIGAIPSSEKGAANEVATLGADGRVVEENQIDYGWRAGGWFSSQVVSLTIQSLNRTDGVLSPLYAHTSVTIDTVGIEVTGGSVGSTVGIAIYKGEPDGSKTLVQDFGNVDTATNGFKSITIDPTLTLTKGIYWLYAWHPENAGTATAVNLRAFTGKSQLLDYNGQTNDFRSGEYRQNFLVAAPASFSKASTPLVAIYAIYVQLRRIP